MEYTLLGIASVIIIALLGWYITFNYKKNVKGGGRAKKGASGNQLTSKCPICGSYLKPGENLISKVYRPMNVPDQLMTVNGCPHCYPKCEAGVKRSCPVCHKTLGENDSLTARLFNKSDNKKHVHIVGCSKCHKPRAD